MPEETGYKIVSLLPSTTEIVCALGMGERLVGRSHECDFPEFVSDLPVCTEPKFEVDASSGETDRRIRELLREGLSVYRVDVDTLTSLDPDIILTQDHCKVCAASLDEVKDAVQHKLSGSVKVVSVSPTDLEGVFESIHSIGSALNLPVKAKQLADKLKQSFSELSQQTKNLPRRKVLNIEWIDPLMTAGNWMPELVHIAGGMPVLGESGKHSPEVSPEDILSANADVINLVPCGYSIQKTLEEMKTLQSMPGWNELKAVRNRQVFVLDGHHYFNRPGPRLADSARILAEILHPERFDFQHKETGWINFFEFETEMLG